LLRDADKDRFLATLFAPAPVRAALYALYAFNVEIARVRERVHEPIAGEIRLQWWTDALGGSGAGEAAAHPVASALLSAMTHYGLPVERLTAMIGARRFDLDNEPMGTLADLEVYADRASANLILLAARILAEGREPAIGDLARHAGRAYAIAGLLKAFPIHAARGQLFVPLEILQRHGLDFRGAVRRPATPQLHAALAEARLIARRHLGQARSLISGAPAVVLPAVLPFALVGPTLARMERRSYDPFVPVEIATWQRQWLIWRAARRAQRIFE
jgi:phytoene synthase